MSNEEMLKKILSNTENLKEDVDILKQDVTILKEDVLILKEDNKKLNRKFDSIDEKVEVLNGKFEGLDEKVEVLNGKFEGLDEKVEVLYEEHKELKETVNSINRSVIKMEHEYGSKIDVIYENTVSFMDANYKNRNDIEKLEKRVERLECKAL